MIKRIHHAQIPIPPGADAQAREFYCGVMGLPEIEKPEILRANGGFWMEVGDQQVHVSADPNPQPANSKAHIAYEVSDLAEWKATLTAHGCNFKDGETIPGFIRAETRDPFGNRMEFLQATND
jgi:catechol 2,3-dioxygenase-like lactoylglutathione lyase family enzyme